MNIRFIFSLPIVLIYILLPGCGKPPCEKICNPTCEKGIANTATTPAINDKNAIPEIPMAIKASQATTLWYRLGKKGRCSAVKITENLILSAAHCTFGYSGNEKQDPIWIEVGGEKHPLKIVDQGDFKPSEGKLGDWVLLEPEEGSEALSHLKIAEFPDQKERTRILANLGEFRGKKKGEAVWTIIYPIKSYRSYPRPAPDGKHVFFSAGFLTSDHAYQERAVYTYITRHTFDDQYHIAPPIFSGVDINKEWEQMKDSEKGMIVTMFEKYKNFDDPILYHTADYSPGGSGGGTFIESTGHLLGISPMKATLLDAVSTYNGLGYLYRIDNICKESKLLKQLQKCKAIAD